MQAFTQFLKDNPIKPTSIISAEKRKSIKNEFGTSKDVPMSIPLTCPPSPKTSLQKAGEHLIKQQKKGFVPYLNPKISPSNIYQSNMIPYIMQQRKALEKKKMEVTSKRIKLQPFEPYQKFWHTSICVTQFVEEIRKLPFYDENEKMIYEGKIHDEVSSIVRFMNQRGELNYTGKTRQQLYQIMKDFVFSIKKLRFNYITNFLYSNKIDQHKLPTSYIEEFNSALNDPNIKMKQDNNQNNATKKDDDELDDKILEHIQNLLTNLPTEYRMSKDMINKHSIKKIHKEVNLKVHSVGKALISAFNNPKTVAQTQPVSPRLPEELLVHKINRTTVISQPFTRQLTCRDQTIKKSPSKKVVINDNSIINPIFWEIADPLGDSRSGQYVNSLKELSNITNDFHMDYSLIEENSQNNISDPFKLSEFKSHDIQTSWSTNISKRKTNTEIIDDETIEEKPIELSPQKDDFYQRYLRMSNSSNFKLHYDDPSKKTDAMEFLTRQNAEVIIDPLGNETHEKLIHWEMRHMKN
ncbi:hypothetical protein TRFO_12188 [Tritrichomonas foetus]|uniref:Uncharacterized protein n=1 Tax=Tritrichomonas foetus TaxID=1144522 RepID=A0A1J4J008_9EUKA|nr:hypothetical protein TRFO_12188 [Tritrichomonas foetus]|eukprot:OHS92990.1 hypothetical protein TRFO_12188 [Tritrichomonas foetus]